MRKIEKKVFQTPKKQSLRVEDLINNENQDYNYQSGVPSTREPIKSLTLANSSQPQTQQKELSKANTSVSNRNSNVHRNHQNGFAEIKSKTKSLRK